MATKADFDARFNRFDVALEAIKAKLAAGGTSDGLTAAEEDQILADLETHVANLEDTAK